MSPVDPGTAIALRGVNKRFDDHREVFRALDLDVPSRGVTFVVGPSGAGKSVLCRIAVGLERPDAGEIFLFGEPVHRLRERQLLAVRRKAPYLVQGPALLDWLTLEGNVAVAAPDRPDRVADALRRVGLQKWAGRYPGELGPGLRKRAAIARALVLEPSLLVLDEPTTGLDRPATRQVSEVLRDLKQEGLGAVVVSHDYPLLGELADRVILVTGRGEARVFPTREAFLGAVDPDVRALLAPVETEVARNG